MAKYKPLPEDTLETPEAKKLSEGISDNNMKASAHKAKMESLKKDLKEKVKTFWDENADKGKFVGLVRVPGESENSSINCEFRMGKAGTALAEDQEDVLVDVLGKCKPIFFQKASLITQVLDPEKVIADLGPDAWEHLELRVKDGHDEIVKAKVEKDSVCIETAFIPKSNFLANLDELTNVLTDKAKAYMREYLKRALTIFVTCK